MFDGRMRLSRRAVHAPLGGNVHARPRARAACGPGRRAACGTSHESQVMTDVTVAIPVRDGGALFARTLQALSTQTVAHELLVCDSHSSDGSAELARAHGARVLADRPGPLQPRRHAQPADERVLRRACRAAHPGRRARRRPLAGAPARGVRARSRRRPRLRALPAPPGRLAGGAPGTGALVLTRSRPTAHRAWIAWTSTSAPPCRRSR